MIGKKKGLGRGLSALFGDTKPDQKSSEKKDAQKNAQKMQKMRKDS